MASREPRDEVARAGGTGAARPRSVGWTDAHPLSWELGNRLTADGAPLVALERGDAGPSIAVFSLTEHTRVVRVRSPVGRERYYEARAPAVADRVAECLRRDRWRVVERSS